MKCGACGEDNVANAKFCAFCGAKLVSSRAHKADEESRSVEPVSDNPYQPRRMPSIYADEGQQKKETASRPQKVFLFDDEKEEQQRKTRILEEEKKTARKRLEQERRQDPFYGEDDEDEDEDDYDEEEEEERSRRRRHIVMALVSLITVSVLIGFVYLFFFQTSVGSRLRAYYGMATKAEDYVYLAQWQRENGNTTDAAASYYNAFRLKSDDYDFAMQIAQDFVDCNALERAEQLYMYLIDKYPNADDPYDQLMALLIREGKQSEYEALLSYRATHQTGYNAQQATQVKPEAPTASPNGGTFTGSVSITLTAEDDVEIHFTVDGSEPSRFSTLYSGQIRLYSGKHTLKAIAVRGNLVSEVLTIQYTVS